MTLATPAEEIAKAPAAPAASRPPGATYRDGAALPEMVVVAAGSFLMGTTEEDDKFASVVELPRHRVEIGRAFAVGRCPVTFDEWDAYAGDNPDAHRPAHCGAVDGGVSRGRLPVVNVSWDDARGYIDWLERRTGHAYRFLSEAEWEYVCRAGCEGVFGTGPRISVEQANYLYTDFRQKPGLGRPVAVGSYAPNAMGVYDMHGNVCELVADAWHDDYRGAPTDGSAWTTATEARYRVARGGGWDALPRILRCAFRDWVARDQRLDNMGFRVACDL